VQAFPPVVLSVAVKKNRLKSFTDVAVVADIENRGSQLKGDDNTVPQNLAPLPVRVRWSVKYTVPGAEFPDVVVQLKSNP
jgi:hypothetical protein